jgi:hypothetical protein
MKVKQKKIYTILFFLWLSMLFPHQVQSFCYNVDTIPYVALPTTPPSDATTITLADDQFSNVIPVGFTFNFFGVNYTDVVIGSNGILSFNTALAGQSCSFSVDAIPNLTTDTHNAILFAWFDFNPTVGGSIFYYTTGVAPNRQFIVVFNSVPGFSCPSDFDTQGVILYENSNNIDIVIAEASHCSVSANATEGIQNADGTEAFAIPNRNGTLWTTANNSYRFSPSANLGPILGSTSVCAGSSQVYFVEPIEGVTNYIWSVPAGWTITNDAANAIEVIVGNKSGTISVATSCDSNNTQSLDVSVTTGITSRPGNIRGPKAVCAKTTHTYSIAPVPGATSYNWTVPRCWIIENNTGTSITVRAGKNGGLISVTASNTCGNSSPQTLRVISLNLGFH